MYRGLGGVGALIDVNYSNQLSLRPDIMQETILSAVGTAPQLKGPYQHSYRFIGMSAGFKVTRNRRKHISEKKFYYIDSEKVSACSV